MRFQTPLQSEVFIPNAEGGQCAKIPANCSKIEWLKAIFVQKQKQEGAASTVEEKMLQDSTKKLTNLQARLEWQQAQHAILLQKMVDKVGLFK